MKPQLGFIIRILFGLHIKTEFTMIRILSILLFFQLTLYSQDVKPVIKLEKGYSINEGISSVDTVLTYKIRYDPLARIKTLVNYPNPYHGDITRVRDHYYVGDTTIELYRTLNFDTLQRVTTIMHDDSKKLHIENKIYGGWLNGEYSKSSENDVRRSKYNAYHEVVESIWYSEGRDTFKHWFYSYEKDSIANSTIRHGHEIRNDKQSKRITQIGLGNDRGEDCNSDCTKRIAINMVKLNLLSGNYNVLIQNGDTVSFYLKTELKLPKNHKMVTYNTYSYRDESFGRIIYYYQSDDIYRKENYYWDDGKWQPSAIEEYQFNKGRTIKSTTRTTFTDGQEAYVYSSFVKYEYF